MILQSIIDRNSGGVSLCIWFVTFIAVVALGFAPGAAKAEGEVEIVEERDAFEPLPERNFFIRAHSGVGFAHGKDANGLAYHVGGRVLFPANLSPKLAAAFGIEATYLELDVRDKNALADRYAVVGVVLEMTVFRHLNLGIGTVGYIGLGDTEGNPFGLVTNIGWEPQWDSHVLPYITLRSDYVFAGEVQSVVSLSAGITFGI
ncbi:MAG: hypothetical protein AAF500_05490 [Myxococcota bacterium]